MPLYPADLKNYTIVVTVVLSYHIVSISFGNHKSTILCMSVSIICCLCSSFAFIIRLFIELVRQEDAFQESVHCCVYLQWYVQSGPIKTVLHLLFSYFCVFTIRILTGVISGMFMLFVNIIDKESESGGHHIQQQWRRWLEFTDCFIQVNTHSKWTWSLLYCLQNALIMLDEDLVDVCCCCVHVLDWFWL